MNSGFALSSLLRISSPILRKSTSHIRRFISSSSERGFPPWTTGGPSVAAPITTIPKKPREITAAFDGPANKALSSKVSTAAEQMPRSNDEMWTTMSRDAENRLAGNPLPDAYTGRSVKVKGEHVGDAYRLLDGILARNKVRAQLRLAERHEKKGVKRRRLSSERWRKQFANEVRKKVQLVVKIRNRGA